jgi:hypothetical protein
MIGFIVVLLKFSYGKYIRILTFRFSFLISEAEDFQPLPSKVVRKRHWADEDVDANDIKDSWEEEDVSAPVYFSFIIYF